MRNKLRHTTTNPDTDGTTNARTDSFTVTEQAEEWWQRQEICSSDRGDSGRRRADGGRSRPCSRTLGAEEGHRREGREAWRVCARKNAMALAAFSACLQPRQALQVPLNQL